MRPPLPQVRRVVLKAGSKILAEELDLRAGEIAADIAAARTRGVQVVFVTSGAIAMGVRKLGLSARPSELAELQACAAVGQGALMQTYDRAFGARGLLVGQVLITHDDFAARGRFLSARRTLEALLAHGVVPIINENDTVAVEEIKFGDNDLISALVSNLVGADLLVALTDVEGLLDPAGKLVPFVREASEAAHAGGASSGVGSGGMASKAQAARAAGRFGVPTVVTSGRVPGALAELLSGTERGTLFVADPGKKLDSRKHWIAYALRPAGTLVVDEGAARALSAQGKSLLPSGVVRVEGEFEVGDPVAITDPAGRELARGLCAYGAGDVRKLAGKRTSEIEAVLGFRAGDEIVHRDDLVLL